MCAVVGLVASAWACSASDLGGLGQEETEVSFDASLPHDEAGHDGNGSGLDGGSDVRTRGEDTGYVSYDAGYYSFDSGYQDGAYDSGYQDGAYDSGYQDGAYDSGYQDGAYDSGYQDGAYDSGYQDGAYDSGYQDGAYDAPPPDSGPLWNGGPPVLLASGENQPLVLALDDLNMYWANSAGVILDCPLAGCPKNSPTLLAFEATFYSSNSLAAGSSTAFFPNGGNGGVIDSCASGGCGLSPTTYWAEADPDAGPNVFSSYTTFSVISDSSNVYFTDGESVYSCPIGSTCPSATVLATAANDESFGDQLAVDAGEVFYQVETYAGGWSIRAVSNTGGTSRLVCNHLEPLLTYGGNGVVFGSNAMVASGGYVYFTPVNSYYNPFIYACPEAGGTATLFTTDESPSGLAADGASLYWTNDSTPGSVGTCALGAVCKGSMTVASGQNDPLAIAVNSAAVFWTTQTAIYSASK
jgi:hypothetical protein